MKTTFIYVLKDPETGEIRYVGKSDTPARRFISHLSAGKYPINHREVWIASVQKRGLQPELEVIDEVLLSEWGPWEAAWIQFYSELGSDLTNGTPGGDSGPSNKGRKMTPSARLKMSQATKSRYSNPEFRAKFKTRLADPETRRKMRAASSLQVQSLETREKKSATLKRRWASMTREERRERGNKMSAGIARARKESNAP